MNSVTPFVGYCLGAAVVVYLSPAVALLVYAVGLATFVPASSMQPSASTRLAELPNGFTAFLSVVISWMLYLARRRDFMQRRTIDEQRAALAELNVGLERRVDEQVAEIVQRAREVEELNAQLAAKVRERSTELSIALAKLAEQNTDRAVPARPRPGRSLRDPGDARHRRDGGRLLGHRPHQRRACRDEGHPGEHEPGARRAPPVSPRGGYGGEIDHPAVVRMIHVDVSDDGMLFQAQELVEGNTLAAPASTRPPLGAGSGRAPGLGALRRARGRARRGHGPSRREARNMMLTSAAPGLKLLDFGISKLYDDAHEDDGSARGPA